MRPILIVPVVGIVLAVIACGSDGAPLGGPFGGTSTASPAPGAAIAQGSDGGESEVDSGSGSGSSGASGSSGGGSDSGSGSSSGSASSSGAGSGSGGSCGTGSSSGSAAGDSGVAPTWTQLYNAYFAVGTIGDCANSACHTQAATASGMYTWLKSTSQDCGKPDCLDTLSSSTASVLSWFGGSMPVTGPSCDPQASADVSAWVAAGSQNN